MIVQQSVAKRGFGMFKTLSESLSNLSHLFLIIFLSTLRFKPQEAWHTAPDTLLLLKSLRYGEHPTTA